MHMTEITTPKTLSKNDIKLSDLELLWNDISSLENIKQWKKRVSEFKDMFNISDLEAINLANKRF